MSQTCMIIDDEPIAHDILINYLSGCDRLILQSQFYNAFDAANFLKETPVDILFLDIEMPGMNGIDFLQSLVQKPVTIITTANRNYALDGFDLGVMDYLVKPIKKERFNTAVDRAIEFIVLQKNNQVMVENMRDEKMKTVTIKSGTKLISLETALISHIQGLKDYSIIYTDKDKYVIKGYLKNMESFLPASHFIRVHKSFIVATHKVKMISQNKIEFDGFTIPIGRVYKTIVESILKRKE